MSMPKYKPDKKKAKELGAAYKKGYPRTYLKHQRSPIYRWSRKAQKKELDRLMAASGVPRPMAITILKKKYHRVGIDFLINK